MGWTKRRRVERRACDIRALLVSGLYGLACALCAAQIAHALSMWWQAATPSPTDCRILVVVIEKQHDENAECEVPSALLRGVKDVSLRHVAQSGILPDAGLTAGRAALEGRSLSDR